MNGRMFQEDGPWSPEFENQENILRAVEGTILAKLVTNVQCSTFYKGYFESDFFVWPDHWVCVSIYYVFINSLVIWYFYCININYEAVCNLYKSWLNLTTVTWFALMGQWGSNGGLFNQAILIYIYNYLEFTSWLLSTIFIAHIRVDLDSKIVWRVKTERITFITQSVLDHCCFSDTENIWTIKLWKSFISHCL